MKIRVLGRFRVTDQGRDHTPTGMAGQLLKAVVCTGRPLHWEELSEMFWPDIPAEQGRVRLRNVRSRLRTTTGSVLIRADDLIKLDPRVSVDMHEFEALALRALAAFSAKDGEAVRLATQAFAQYRGDLLPEDRYAQWTQEPRERLRRRASSILGYLVADARQRQDWAEALLLLERAMALQPDAEEVALHTVDVLLTLGQRLAALRLLRQTAERTAQLGLQPSARWELLHAQVRAVTEPRV